MDRTKLYTCPAEFDRGEKNNLTYDDTIGNGALVLVEGTNEGSFVSDVFELPAFAEALMSWNVDAPEGTYVKPQARVRVDGAWSSWLSWGEWAPAILRSSHDTKGELAEISCDTLSVYGAPEKLADAAQIRCDLFREEGAATPALRLLGITVRRSLDDRLKHTMGPIEIDNPAPAYSQLNRDPNMARRMCSGVTTTVLLNAQGENLMPEEMALLHWDEEYEGIGNWSFSVSAAGALGYEAYAVMTDVDGMKQLLMEGYPLGAAVAYSNTQERATARSPYVENTPGFTPGHLMTIRGMTTIDGREYVLVNDSYGEPDSAAILQFPLDQFQYAWKGVLYVVGDKLDGAGYTAGIRIPAKLEATDFGDEWKLVVDGEEKLLPADFHGQRKRAVRGSIAYTVSDGREYATDANREVFYTKVTTNGYVFLPARQLLMKNPMGNKGVVTVYVMTNKGITYVAELTKADL